MGTLTAAQLETMYAGRRVQIPPHYDAWMFGDRYGVIDGFRRTGNTLTARVLMDRSGKVRRFPVDEVLSRTID